MSNLGQLVKWQDAAKGWHTGRVVMTPVGAIAYPQSHVGSYCETPEGELYTSVLVQESCCGTLTWVDFDRLEEYLSRKERGEE